jgi:hypothetical protein
VGRTRSPATDGASYEAALSAELIDAYIASFSGNKMSAAEYAKIPWGVLENLRHGIPHDHSTRHGWSAGKRLAWAIKKRLPRDQYVKLMKGAAAMTKDENPAVITIPYQNGKAGEPELLALAKGAADLLVAPVTVSFSKRCPHCGADKPAVSFNKNSASPDGLQSWCRSCTKINDRQRHDKPAEKETPVTATITPILASASDAVAHHVNTVKRALSDITALVGEFDHMVASVGTLTASLVASRDETVTLRAALDAAYADQAELWALAGTGSDAATLEENAALHTKVAEQARQIAALLSEVKRLRAG